MKRIMTTNKVNMVSGGVPEQVSKIMMSLRKTELSASTEPCVKF